MRSPQRTHSQHMQKKQHARVMDLGSLIRGEKLVLLHLPREFLATRLCSICQINNANKTCDEFSMGTLRSKSCFQGTATN
jgi:hypothetical protein